MSAVNQDAIDARAEAAEAAADPVAEEAGGSFGYYADDVPFRSGVVQAQAPLTMAVAAALNGYAPPRPQGHFRYLDLGCGNGTTLNAFAAIYPEAEFVGIDFNAGHIADARRLAEAAGLDNVRFIQGSFAEIDGGDLPVFDFIGMNGIYSWLERDLLPAVHGLVGRHLRPGGLFYVEYMTMPGMIAVVPLWQLIQALVPPDDRGSHERATRGLRVLEELTKSGMGYLERHPTAKRAAAGYASSWRSNPNQIDHFAHNALASGFRPRFVTEMCAEMAAAGLTFAGRTPLALNDPDLAVTLQQATLLRGVEDRPTRELLADFMRNERNRRDVFVKAGTPDPADARAFLLEEVRFLSRLPTAQVTRELKLPGPRTIAFEGPVYDRLIAAFDGAARSARTVDPDRDLGDDTLLTAVHRLNASGQFFLCDPAFAGGPLPQAPERLTVGPAINRVLLETAAQQVTATSLVARAVGGAVMTLGPLETVLLLAWLDHGHGQAVEAAMRRLAGSDGDVRIARAVRPVRDLKAEELAPVLQRLARIRVPNLLRVGALAAA